MVWQFHDWQHESFLQRHVLSPVARAPRQPKLAFIAARAHQPPMGISGKRQFTGFMASVTPTPTRKVREKIDTNVSIAGTKAASRTGQLAWALSEFASGPYFIVINVFVFATYFTSSVVGDGVKGQEYWAYLQGSAGFLIALMSPFLGSLADASGPRKPFVFFFSVIGVPAMCALWFATPGDILPAFIALIIAAIAMEFAGVFQQAMLPSIVSARRVGFLSGLGYTLSYVGATLVFALWLLLPQTGWLDGMSDNTHERLTGTLCAIWYVIFILPLFVFTPDLPHSGLSLRKAAAKGLRTLGTTLRRLDHYRNIAVYLVARLLYYDGLTAVFTFIGPFAHFTFGWSTEKVGLYGLVIILTAAISASFGGLIDDLIGSKRTIQLSLIAFSLGLAGNLGMSPDTILYVIPVSAEMAASQVPLVGGFLSMLGFVTLPEQLFVVIGVFGGMFAGPALSSSRTMLARIAPPSMIAEFFGLYTLTGRATAFLAPLTIGAVTHFTQDQRSGLMVIFVFIALGFIGLLAVRERPTEALHH